MWRSIDFGVGFSVKRTALIAIALAVFGSAAVLAEPAGRGGAGFGFSGNSGNDTLTVFDLVTGLAVGPDIDLLPEGDYPYDVTIHPDGSEVWICGAVGDGVIVVDTTTHAIVERISLTGSAEYSVDVAFNADGSVAYVAGRDSDAVAVVDTATYMVTGTIPIPTLTGPGKMAFSTERNELYVVEWYEDDLYVIDAATEIVTPVTIGDSLWDLVLDVPRDVLYVNDRGTDEVHVFDLVSLMVTSSFSVGDDPWGIDLTPDGLQLVVANEDDSTVSVIDLVTEGITTVTLPAGADPRDVDVAEDGSVAYVPSGDVAGDDDVYVIDLAMPSVAGTVDLGTVTPNSLAVTPEAATVPSIFADGFESGDTGAWSSALLSGNA